MGKSIHVSCVASHLGVEGVVASEEAGELILQILVEIYTRISVVNKRLGILEHGFVGLGCALTLALRNVSICNIADRPYGCGIGFRFLIEGDAEKASR